MREEWLNYCDVFHLRLKITGFMEFVRRKEFFNNWKTQRFREWIYFRLQVKGGRDLLCWVCRANLNYRTQWSFETSYSLLV
jgi:hypothetical protein